MIISSWESCFVALDEAMDALEHQLPNQDAACAVSNVSGLHSGLTAISNIMVKILRAQFRMLCSTSDITRIRETLRYSCLQANGLATDLQHHGQILAYIFASAAGWTNLGQHGIQLKS